MNNNFAKTAIAAGVVAALSYSDASVAAALAPVANDVVVLGCSVPSAGTTVATVYSIDAVSSQNSTYTLSLPTAVAVGSSCAGALAALAVTGNNSIYFSNGAGVPVSQAIPGTGYSLQQFTLVGSATAASSTSASAGTGFIGCAAPGSTGATVYSVDATNQTNTSSVVALNNLVGKPCSYALARAALGTSTGFGGTSTVTANGNVVLNINSTGYSLSQYTFQ